MQVHLCIGIWQHSDCEHTLGLSADSGGCLTSPCIIAEILGCQSQANKNSANRRFFYVDLVLRCCLNSFSDQCERGFGHQSCMSVTFRESMSHHVSSPLKAESVRIPNKQYRQPGPPASKYSSHFFLTFNDNFVMLYPESLVLVLLSPFSPTQF